MSSYIQKALQAYCDPSQTKVAREIAESALLNAGFTEHDLRMAHAKGLESFEVFIFEA